MRKKLGSQQGVAMIFAIAAFAVVMVLGTVFLTAGYANYSKLFGRKNDRQDYYTLVSAAKYAGSQLDGATVKIQEIYDDDDNSTEEKDDNKFETLYTTGVSFDAGEGLTDDEAEWVVAVVEKACCDNEGKLGGADVSYQLKFEGAADSFYTEVTVTLSAITFTKSGTTDATTDVYEPVKAEMKLKTQDGKNEAVVEFTVSPTNTLSYSIAKKELESGEEKEVHRLTDDTVYTFRMGDIITGNGGSES